MTSNREEITNSSICHLFETKRKENMFHNHKTYFVWETPHPNATSINYNYKNNNRKENRQKKLKDVNAKQ